MTGRALRTLAHRSERLRAALSDGTATEIKAAREMLRLSLIELYGLGHWRNKPNDLQNHMHLFRAAEPSAQPSKSEPDRTARYSP
jgi:tRNA(Met) C34 N-acetyltransferase TmcA